jgi:hypothetical protein
MRANHGEVARKTANATRWHIKMSAIHRKESSLAIE